MKDGSQFIVRAHFCAVAIACIAILALPAAAQEGAPVVPKASGGTSSDPAEPNGDLVPAEYVSIHVDGGDMRQVLNSFAMQANRNIVIGPEVTNDSVNIHLNNVQWENALDVILKPYGYGYRQVGDATVVGELSRLRALETVEPLQSRIYKLKYLDANDVDGIIEGMLSPRGKMNIITARGQKGWKDLVQKNVSSSQSSGASLEMREREEEQVRSKTIVVTDVPSVLDSVAETLEGIDQIPQQVLVEARFMEVNENALRDIGAQFGIGWKDSAGNAFGFNQRMFNNQPNSAYKASGTSLSGAGKAESPTLTGGATWQGNTSQAGSILDTGGQFFGIGGFQNINMEMYINLLEEDVDTKTLSAPKVVTMDNQEAAIVVGTRYPIIRSQFDPSAGGSTSVRSETLDYYESIGIQLNVVPQICADGYIKMIVRPSVTEIIDERGLNEYPVIKTRDTETQVLAADGQTIVIGGLLEDREANGQVKVPFLGDIPYLGRLFRRDTNGSKTIDLLIFITATVVNEVNYGLIVKKEETTEPAVIEVIEPDMGVISEEEPAASDNMEAAEVKSVEEIMIELN